MMTNVRLPNWFMPGARAAIELALEHEKLLTHGRALGLTEAESAEVTSAWCAWYRTTPYPIDWAKIRRAQILRAFDHEWRP